jgi:photosystem II stability/assembly factor-like uncharacterized protein
MTRRIVSRALAAGFLIGALEMPSNGLAGIGQLLDDDFEAGTDAWSLDPNWSLVDESGDTVLEGSGLAWATAIEGDGWTDYLVTVDVKMLAGSAQIMLRVSDEHGRYIVGLHPGGVYLRKESPWEKISADLATAAVSLPYGTWHTVAIDASGRRIQVAVDGTPYIDFTDPASLATWPLWQGTIGLEAAGSPSAQVRFDDVWVWGLQNPPGYWHKTGGPIGGLGYDVRFGSADRQVLYVTDNFSGLYKSVDGGTTWFATNRGITGRFAPSGDAVPVFSVTVDPNNPSILWAGLKDVKGVYRSANGGLLWENRTPNSTVLPEAEFVFRGFTIMPGDSDTVFAAGEIPTPLMGDTFGLVRGRVYKTTDAGATWEPIWEDENLARYVIVRPDDPNTIYISSGIFDREAADSDCTIDPPDQGFGGVMRTTNGGASWEVLDTDHDLTDHNVGSLFMHPENPDILIAGAGNVACSPYTEGSETRYTGGVFITTNGGDTWEQTLSNDIITSDGGATWDLVAGETFPWGPPGTIAGFPIDFLVDPENPMTIFANNYGGGNVMSTDGGESWQLASKGYTGAQMFDLALHACRPNVLYSSALSGPFRTLDWGAAWEGLAYPPARLVETYAVALNPQSPNIVLASSENLGQLWRSVDGGFTWDMRYDLPLVTGVLRSFKRLEFAPSDGSIVYAGTAPRNNVLRGDSTTPSYGIYKSADGGLNWDPANDSQTADCTVNDLAVHPDSPDIVYAATAAEGLYRSTDGGASWLQLTGLSINDVRAVAIDPHDPDVVYAGAEGTFSGQPGGVYRSLDAGDNWTPMIAGMEPNDPIWSIVVDPLEPGVVYAGSFYSGVYRWDPGLSVWTHMNDGLRTRAVTDLALSPVGGVLYAATWGEGVFRVGSPVFMDGFECADVSPWSSSSGDGWEVAPDSALYGGYGMRITVAPTCPSTEDDLVLTDEFVTEPTSWVGCRSITARDSFIVAAGGAATLAAGERVVLGNLVSVQSGGSLTAATDPSLAESPFVYLQDDSPAGETSYRAEFWLNLDGLTVAAGDEIEHFVAYDAAEVVRFRLLLQSGPTLVLEARDDLGSPHATAAIPLSPGWTRVGIAWQSSPSASISLSVGDGVVAELSAIDTEDTRIDTVRWGVVGGTLAASSGTLALDQFVSWR